MRFPRSRRSLAAASRTTRLAVVALLVVVAGSCGRRPAVVQAGGHGCPELAEVDHPQPQNVEALPAFPMQHLEDWTTYGDAVAVVTVNGEREDRPSANAAARGEGVTNRWITVTQRTLWRRPGAPTPPASWTELSSGWRFDGGERRPAVNDSGQWLRVGRSYVVPLSRTPEGGWATIDEGAIPLACGRLVVSGASDRNPLVPRLRGTDLAQVGDVLRAAPPDPAAAPFMQLDAQSRWRAVARSRHALPAH